MKLRKILLLTATIFAGISLSGCSAEITDLDEQINKIKEVKVAGDLYREDYKIIKTESNLKDNTTIQTKTVFQKDENKIYMSSTKDGKLLFETWVGEKTGKHYVFYFDGEYKEYEQISKAEFNDLIKKLENSDNALKEYYEEVVDDIVENKNMCVNADTECIIKKGMLNKKITFELEKTTSSGYEIFETVIENGKVLKLAESDKEFSEKSNLEINFDYGNQTIILPSIEDYLYVEGVADNLR